MLMTRSFTRKRNCGNAVCRYSGKSGTSLTVHDLPDIVLMQIFSHVSLRTLCRMALVCKRWMILSYDSTLWRFVDLSPYKDVETDTILDLIHSRLSPLLRFLDLSNCRISTNILCELASGCKSLEALKLSNCSWRSVSCGGVNFPQRLTCLDLRDFGGDYTLLGELLNGLTTVRKLNYLGFGNCLSSDVAFSAFKAQVMTLKNLTVLEICDSEDVGDAFLYEVAQNMPCLQSVSLRRCPRILGITLTPVLERLEHLVTLVLFRTGVLDEYLISPRWERYKIEEIDLSFNDHLSERTLVSILPKLNRLRYVSLNNCGRGHAFSEEVANRICATNCWSLLETLSLQFCKHLHGHMLEKVLNNHNIRHLSLRSSHNISFLDVSQILHHLPSLETFEVGALFSLDENGKDWDRLMIELGKHCRSLVGLTLVKCFFAPRWKLRDLKASIRFFLTKCSKLRRLCVLYSELTICDLFREVLTSPKFQILKNNLTVTSTTSEEAIPPTKHSLDYYFQNVYSSMCK